MHIISISTIATDIAVGFGCLLAVDFITGVVHWCEDTYAVLGKSALLDRLIVVDNIEHHRRPGTIRDGSYWSTNAVCARGAAVVAIVLVVLRVHAWQPYLIALPASQANQVHRWAHCAKRPILVRALQAIGLLQSRRHHGRHHGRRFASHYCAFTNFLNPTLDGIRFWRGCERALAHLGIAVQRGSRMRDGY